MLTGATLFTLLGFKNGEAYQALGMIPIVNAMLAAFITLRWKISVHGHQRDDSSRYDVVPFRTTGFVVATHKL